MKNFDGKSTSKFLLIENCKFVEQSEFIRKCLVEPKKKKKTANVIRLKEFEKSFFFPDWQRDKQNKQKFTLNESCHESLATGKKFGCF